LKDYEIWEYGYQGKIAFFRRKCRQFVTSRIIDNFILICVIMNTGILAIDGLYSNPTLLDTFNTIFTFIFAGEMVIYSILFFGF